MIEFNLITFIAVIINILILYILFRLLFFKPIKKIIDKRNDDIKEKEVTIEEHIIEARNKIEESNKNLHDSEIEATKIINNANDLYKEIIQTSKNEAKKQSKEILLASEDEIKSTMESSNIVLKKSAIKISESISKQILSSVINKEVDLIFIKTMLLKHNEIELFSETGVKQSKIKEIIVNAKEENTPINVLTANELTEDIKVLISEILNNLSGVKISPNFILDKKIIGGFTLSIGYNELDLSINGQIQYLLKELQ